jgi:ABC-2 type transport system permease protein
MQKLFALIYKDFLLLIRDRAGIALLFLMPLVLVFIMTSIQDNTFKSINETKISLIILNNDNDSLGLTIERELEKSNIFSVSKEINNKKPTEATLIDAVASGVFQIGIIIPADITKKLRKNSKRNISRAFSGLTADTITKIDTSQISVYIDPITKNSFKTTIFSSLREFTSKIENEIIIAEITKEINQRLPFNKVSLNSESSIIFKEEYALKEHSTIIPNSVQHNVPAWTMFAMFFIVISLAGNMIKEREEGSVSRLLTMPCSYSTFITSKVLVYIVVCLLQLFLMLLMGVYFFPTLGLPSLKIGINIFAIFTIALSSSLAAIGYGVLIGTFSTTHQQAATFGSISVMILAAIGGVWVPVFAMPPFMRTISVISPLNWGLNGFYEVFIREGNTFSVLFDSFKLIVFFGLCLLASSFYNRVVKK